MEKIKNKKDTRTRLSILDHDTIFHYCYYNHFHFFVVTTIDYPHQKAWNLLRHVCTMDYTDQQKAQQEIKALQTPFSSVPVEFFLF